MKHLMRIWVGYHNFERAKEDKAGKYITIMLTPSSEENVDAAGEIFNDGVLGIVCDEYEIVGSGTGKNWWKIVRFSFDGRSLMIYPKVEQYTFSFPVPVED